MRSVFPWNGGNRHRIVGEPLDYRGFEIYEIDATTEDRYSGDIVTLWEIDELKSGTARPFLTSRDDAMRFIDDLLADLEGPHPEAVTSTVRIVAHGTSLSVNITKEAKAIGVMRGDIVEITMRRIE